MLFVTRRSLCAAGCSVDARRVNGQAALTLCVVSRASRRSPRLLLQLLEVLLAAGADPGVREKLRGQTALHALAKLVAADPGEPHLLTALRLLAQRAQPHGVNAQDHRRRTALHHLAGKGCARPEPYQVSPQPTLCTLGPGQRRQRPDDGAAHVAVA